MEQNNFKRVLAYSTITPASYGSLGLSSETWASIQPSRRMDTEYLSGLTIQDTIIQILKDRNIDIARLDNEIAILKGELTKIKKQSNSINTPIKNLYSDRLTLKESLNIILKEEDGYFTVTSPDLDIYGVGDSMQESIKDLGENIEDVYLTFKKEGRNKLGPDMLKVWEFMSKTIKEKHATKGRGGKKSL